MLHLKLPPQTLLAVALALTTTILTSGSAAQSVSPAAQWTRDYRAELESFDDFLDAHRAIAHNLRRNPSLIANEEFAINHPELDEFLKNHPAVVVALREHPEEFMRREKRFAEAGDHVSRYELNTFDHLLEQHRELAAELRQNPALADDHGFLARHADLREFFEDHPHLHDNFRQHPSAFLDSGWELDRRNREQPVVYHPMH